MQISDVAKINCDSFLQGESSKGQNRELPSFIAASPWSIFCERDGLTKARHVALDQFPIQSPPDPMKPISFIALLCTALFCSSANAEFYIDNFSTLDAEGGGATSIGSNGITVEVSKSGGALVSDTSLQQYQFLTTNAGDSFTIAYDWSGVFNSLQSVSGHQLETIPVSLFGTWDMEVDTGVSTVMLPATSALASPIALDNATKLDFTFTYIGGSVFGISGATFGGASQPLFATPEPTAFFMLGSAGVILMTRRRRKA